MTFRFNELSSLLQGNHTSSQPGIGYYLSTHLPQIVRGDLFSGILLVSYAGWTRHFSRSLLWRGPGGMLSLLLWAMAALDAIPFLVEWSMKSRSFFITSLTAIGMFSQILPFIGAAYAVSTISRLGRESKRERMETARP